MASKGKKGSKKRKKTNKNISKKDISELSKNTVEEKNENPKDIEKSLSKKEIENKEDKKEIKEIKEENKKEIKKEEQENKTEDLIQKSTDKENIKENLIKDVNNNETIKKENKTKIKNINLKKKKCYSILFIFIIFIIIAFFSIIFALLNKNVTNMAKGVKIKNIDVSGLSIQETRTKIEEALRIELMQEINIKYENKYETNLESTQIEFSYDIEKSLEKAYKVGRSGNIFKDNYELLYTAFIGKNIDIDYTYNKEFLDNFINQTEANIPGVVTQASYYIEDSKLIINKGIDGVGIDKEYFKNSILKNITNRHAEDIVQNNSKQQIEIPIITKKADPIDIEKIYQEIYTEPKDAYYELEPFNIYPEVNGVDLKIGLEEAKKQIEAEVKDEYQFDLKITPPEITIKSFGIEAFPNLVSSFSTKYDAKNINRSKNLEIAARKINGLVLMPDEVFSFNKVVGKRTVEEGYKDAKIYVDGAVVDGLAGGICQISSTLYNAVLLANLEIVERRNHSFTISYVPAGRDATVVYGTTDFQFKNSRSYPIKIEATVDRGVAIFKIHSVSLEENEYEIKIKPIITQSIPYEIEYIQDPTLLPGQQIVVQSGQSGYRVTTYKELNQNGRLISKDILSNDVYKPMKSIIRIGP